MTTVITQPIVAYSVVTDEPTERPQQLHESINRPEVLCGSTFKIKTPLSDHALYVTINDIIFNPGTPEESRYPFEVFINSKEMSHYQWVLAMTRVISAVFRKGGECAFLVDELKSVFDPKGGYFKKGGKFMPSLVAEIGEVLERHLVGLGLYQKDESLAVAAQAMINEKMEKMEKNGVESKMQICQKCGQKSAILMDGCWTCTAEGCYHSKCG
jgi:hypothetical protein